MELRTFLVSLLFLLIISAYTDARKSSSGSRRRGGSNVYRPRSTPAPRITNPPQPHVSEKQKGQEYRDWAAKLTGAGNEQKPKLSGTTNQQHQGSNPNKIGWNIPATSQKQNSAPSNAAKPSAPMPDHNVATKVNAPNVQSGYNPSGNTYGHNPSQSYNPSVGHGYNPPVGGQSYNQPYNPSVGQSYNHPSFGHPHNPAGGQPYSPAGGHGYNPSYNQGYNPSVGQAYNPPSYGQIYHPPAGQGYNPPVGQSIVVVPGQTGQAYRPGIGQLAKEALVFAGVSAGVNAAVNRLLPGGGHSGGGSGGGGGVTHTQITYNNYYNNQTDSQGSNAPIPAPAAASAAAPAAPQPNPAIPVDPNASTTTSTAAPAPNAASSDAQASAAANQNTAANSNSNDQNAQGNTMTNASPTGFIITDEDIQKLSEDLLTKDKNNANQYITLNLQGKKMDDSVTDDAPEPLLTVKPEALEIPTVKAVRSLFDNYELDVKVKENVTPEKRKEEMELLDVFLATDVLSSAMKFLADKGYIPNDEYEYKDALRRIWFSQFKRGDGEPSSSGFETVYLAEKFDSDIIGLHNWIYFNDQETAKKLNYLGYIKDVGLGDKGAIVKLRDSLNEIVQPVTTIFVGTSPELEMALYTVCFYTRPNGPCPVSLGGNKFVIIAHRFNYFGKDILVSAYPEI